MTHTRTRTTVVRTHGHRCRRRRRVLLFDHANRVPGDCILSSSSSSSTHPSTNDSTQSKWWVLFITTVRTLVFFFFPFSLLLHPNIEFSRHGDIYMSACTTGRAVPCARVRRIELRKNRLTAALLPGPLIFRLCCHFFPPVFYWVLRFVETAGRRRQGVQHGAVNNAFLTGSFSKRVFFFFQSPVLPNNTIIIIFA